MIESKKKCLMQIYYLIFITEEGDIRLVNGDTYSEGRVEIYYNNTWGTICDHWWDARDADVACRELGFQRAHTAHHGSYFGLGTGPVWYDSMECEGTEERLVDCVKTGPGLSDRAQQRCQHSNDAGATCKVYGKLRSKDAASLADSRFYLY